MNRQEYSYMELGMLLGIFVGGGLGVILSALTGNAVYFALVGLGLALGIGLGAGFDGLRQTRRSEPEQVREQQDYRGK